MNYSITKQIDEHGKQYVNKELYQFNLEHFPQDLAGRYEEVGLVLKDENDNIRGGIIGAVCWNWFEVDKFYLDKSVRKMGYGTKMLAEIEKIALEKQCDFIKLDTLSFQALGFYEKNGYQVYGSIDNVGREFTHYYLKKDIQK
ncbi:GNAT family N-acetyltransferase [Metabacillus malikii]|uniref:GNAT superfamily N-acetyltransferase n=1 Tax=Metabacillus malikii TaxID=1504265 RepID=A0ABT9Z9V6_9BACI|nr:GNAT family N-acetyltransferase [Metabacillus malikii]MDQ0229021.1 GNAT superfamily N-acetyltransferase [Metabacillus malikii]